MASPNALDIAPDGHVEYGGGSFKLPLVSLISESSNSCGFMMCESAIDFSNIRVFCKELKQPWIQFLLSFVMQQVTSGDYILWNTLGKCPSAATKKL